MTKYLPGDEYLSLLTTAPVQSYPNGTRIWIDGPFQCDVDDGGQYTGRITYPGAGAIWEKTSFRKEEMIEACIKMNTLYLLGYLPEYPMRVD